jgi:rhodanese-related sulfurtransferase
LFSSVRADEEVVVYCTSVDCRASLALYHELVARDYRNVRRYEGGLTEWEEAGLPLEGEWAPSRSPSGPAD